MATVDRIDPAYVPWSPAASGFSSEQPTTRTSVGTDEDEYVGRHRRPGVRRANFLRMFYGGRHRR